VKAIKTHFNNQESCSYNTSEGAFGKSKNKDGKPPKSRLSRWWGRRKRNRVSPPIPKGGLSLPLSDEIIPTIQGTPKHTVKIDPTPPGESLRTAQNTVRLAGMGLPDIW
jgi:hypothetical protein